MKEIEVVSKTSKSSSSDLEIEIAKLLYEAPKEDIGEDRMNSSAGFGDASADGRSVSPTKESPSCSKGLNKLVHLWLQGVALASGIFWIWRKFQGKDGIVANFYSLHSWMGLASVSLFRPQVFAAS
ncbi:putative transmembrane ascorbate ferrireductase 4 [Glycine soja]